MNPAEGEGARSLLRSRSCTSKCAWEVGAALQGARWWDGKEAVVPASDAGQHAHLPVSQCSIYDSVRSFQHFPIPHVLDLWRPSFF